MNLTWHIVRKDLRRLAWPVAIWIGFRVVATGWMRFASWSGETPDVTDATGWIRMTEAFVRVTGVVAAIALVVLAGVLGLEDRMTGTDAFWRTRPLTGLRLLQAKLWAALLLLVVAPVAALMPVWGLSGLDGGEMLRAAAALAAWHGGLAICALSLAALTEDLGQQAFAALAWFGLSILAVTFVPALSADSDANPRMVATREWLIGVLPFAAAAAALGWQYRTGRTRVGWAILVAGMALMCGVRLMWRWEPGGLQRGDAAPKADGAGAVALRAPGASESREVPRELSIDVSEEALRDGWPAPWSGTGEWRWRGGGFVRVEMGRNARWGDMAALRVVGLHAETGPLRWEMSTRLSGGPEGPPRAGSAEFVGWLEWVRLRPQVLYELPLRAGMRAEAGASSTRIVGWAKGESDLLLIEERDARSSPPAAFPRGGRSGPGRDGFVVVQRALGVATAVRVRELGSAGLNGLRVGLRGLEVVPPGRETGGKGETVAGWREGASLVKVRFEPVGRFEHERVELPLMPAAEGKKP